MNRIRLGVQITPVTDGQEPIDRQSLDNDGLDLAWTVPGANSGEIPGKPRVLCFHALNPTTATNAVTNRG